MNALRFLRRVLLALVPIGVAAHAASTEAKREDARKAVAKEEQSPKGKRYAFEHQLLPGLTHRTQGGFFAEVYAGSAERLRAAARQVVGVEFAEGVTVRVVPGASAVLISFPKPVGTPECFHALVIKTGETYRYVTLEMTSVLFAREIKSVVGEWAADDSRTVIGGRQYTDSEAFIAEVVGRKE